MADIDLVYGAEGSGDSVVVDGVTYRVIRVDDGGRSIVALALASLTAFTTVSHGQETVVTAGTAVQLTTQVCKALTVRALPGNADNIYVGAAGVDSANGHVLEPGAALDLVIDNVNRLYIDADTNGEGVSWLALS